MASIKIVLDKGINNRQIIYVDNIPYSSKQLSKKLGIVVSTLYVKFKRLQHDENALILWVRKKEWLKQHGLKPETAVYYRDDFYITAAEISAQTKLTTVAAHIRGRKFEAKLLTKEELLKKSNCINSERDKHGKPQWGNLESRVRNENLKGIPNSTEFDKKVRGQYSGKPNLTGLANK